MVGPSMKESEQEQTPEQRTDILFQRMDKNNDQLLSLPEFTEGVKGDSTIVKFLQCEI
jgi:Ca2+-binding EF-hand superfamily protein